MKIKYIHKHVWIASVCKYNDYSKKYWQVKCLKKGYVKQFNGIITVIGVGRLFANSKF